jgi:hypothetical protein
MSMWSWREGAATSTEPIHHLVFFYNLATPDCDELGEKEAQGFSSATSREYRGDALLRVGDGAMVVLGHEQGPTVTLAMGRGRSEVTIGVDWRVVVA